MDKSPDYKFGQVEQKLTDMSSDLYEWKQINDKQHENILQRIETVRCTVEELSKNVTALQVKSGFIGGLAGVGSAIAAIIIHAFL